MTQNRTQCLTFIFCPNYAPSAPLKEVEFPQELIDRLSNSEIHSISDLQRLLDIDSVGKFCLLLLSTCTISRPQVLFLSLTVAHL